MGNEIQPADRAAALERVKALTGSYIKTVNSQSPTRAQLAELREGLADAPELAEALGDCVVLLQSKIIRSIAPTQPGLQAVMTAWAIEMAKELGTSKASLPEKLLIDHAVTCWLRLQAAELAYQAFQEQGGTFAKAAYLERRLSATQRRYLAALESLARVRGSLKRMPVQVNFANQQINQVVSG